MISSDHARAYQNYYTARGCLPLTAATKRLAWHYEIEALLNEQQPASVLDFGCAPDRALWTFSNHRITNYDPGVPGLDELAFDTQRRKHARYDVVVCSHTLEHCANKVEGIATLNQLLRLANKAVFFVVSCQPSTKQLLDGTPWHTCVMQSETWAALCADGARKYGFKLTELAPKRATEYAAVLLK